MSANSENSPVATGLEKVSFHSNLKGKTKECSNYYTIVLISHASKIMLKILQARLQQCVNQELPDVHTGFQKGRGIQQHIKKLIHHDQVGFIPIDTRILQYTQIY